MAAAIGNQYAAKGKQWAMAIDRALDKRGAFDRKTALDELAKVLLDTAAEGEMGALKELGDRLDGKPAQAVEVANREGETFATSVEVKFVGDRPT